MDATDVVPTAGPIRAKRRRKMVPRERKRVKLLPEMEGRTARWYARNRGTPTQRAEYRQEAARLAEALPADAAVLEIAPGPGYLAVEIARRGPYRVTGLDISRTMVEIARENVQAAGVRVDVERGDVAHMPFEAESFDLIVCQAAFKNFVEPVGALNEMHRVLRRGGTAVIQDLRKDVTGAAIDQEVQRMQVSRTSALLVRCTLRRLRRRAYTRARFEQLVAQSAFRDGTVTPQGIGMEVRLTKA